MLIRQNQQRVAILLSTFNGEFFLDEQLESLLNQTHKDWILYWRDDGSHDNTRAVMADFALRAGQGRCVELAGPSRNLGSAVSFHALLAAVTSSLAADDMVAFADQDDVWLPGKLARGLAAFATVPPTLPALYCARQVLVDARLNRIGLSAIAAHGGFPASLTQNVATGCTMMLNGAAARQVAASRPPTVTQHDWWCYLLVTAAGGVLLQDPEPVILYRQHAGNAVGAPSSVLRRGMAAMKRGPHAFMAVLRQNVASLLAQPAVLTEQAMAELQVLDRALRGGRLRRFSALRLRGLVRQTWIETVVFRAWFIFG